MCIRDRFLKQVRGIQASAAASEIGDAGAAIGSTGVNTVSAVRIRAPSRSSAPWCHGPRRHPAVAGMSAILTSVSCDTDSRRRTVREQDREQIRGGCFELFSVVQRGLDRTCLLYTSPSPRD